MCRMEVDERGGEGFVRCLLVLVLVVMRVK